MNIFFGLMIPFMGTVIGAASVFFIKDRMSGNLERGLMGFASGVMVAASVWSLLIPAMKFSENMGKLAFLPAITGVFIGAGFLFIMDKIIPHIHLKEETPEGAVSISAKLERTTMLVFAVILHNIPEGMGVGVVFAGVLSGKENVTLTGAIALAVGIAIQNIPEGAIISLPLKTEGKMSKAKAFLLGSLSGIVEPIGALLTLLLISIIEPLLPYFLSFAAGAMLYVVVEELIPYAKGKHSDIGTIGFIIGFAIMMSLDVALG